MLLATSHVTEKPSTDVDLRSRKWFSVVRTLIDNDIRHHSGQNVVDSLEATTNFDHCDEEYHCR